MEKKFYLILTLFFLFSILTIICDDRIIDLNSYKYPLPEEESSEFYTIAIVGTNDVHGAAFPKQLIHPVSKQIYQYGGLEYMSSYIKIIREDFKERFLWLDGGDQFQGTIENFLSKGEIITDFYNTANVNASVIGNHEFDFGRDFLTTRMNSSVFEYLVSNIYNNQTNLPFEFPHSRLTTLYSIGKIKVGVIGLTTIETLFTTSGDLSNLKFLNYQEIVIKLSKDLRAAGADIVLVTSHVGVQCPNDIDEKMRLMIRNISTPQAQCRDSDEMYVLLQNLPNGTLDGVIGGHVHDVVHHWFNGIPMVQSVNGGFYFNVLYFTFDKNKKVVNTKIEGPIPVCEKIFESIKTCSLMQSTGESGELLNFRFHDRLILSDPEVTQKFSKWVDPVKPYKEIISQTEIDLIGSFDGEHILGDVITDCMKSVGNADVAILNQGALRTFWLAGPITFEDIFNMFPFQNYVVTVEMTGAELRKTLSTIQSAKKAFYPTSGVVQKLTLKPKKSFVSVQLLNGVNIDEKKTYVVSLVDFLINGQGGDDFTEVLKWYTPRKRKQIGLFRDLIREYLRKFGTITQSVIDTKNPRISIVDKTKFLDEESFSS
jgi:2',3'-cyclic-nucleotide 2'-phosphodiesterase (5'-nucleotidase family)